MYAIVANTHPTKAIFFVHGEMHETSHSYFAMHHFSNGRHNNQTTINTNGEEMNKALKNASADTSIAKGN